MMSRGKGKNCRLCLKVLDDDYNVVEEIITDIFEVLLLKVDLSVSEEPLVCKSCMESVKEAFDFKSTCFAVDEQVVSLVIDRNSAELDIRDVYLIENENKNFALHEDYNVCRFCLQFREKSNLILLNDLRKDSVDEMLFKCIPELDLNIIKEPVVCAACIKSLQSYYGFAMKCQNTEENIVKYCESQGAECNGQISLRGVLKYVFKSMPDCSKGAALKRDTYSEINNLLKIEEEDLIITVENIFKTEGISCGETKQKEVVKYSKLIYEDSSEKHMLIYKDNTNVTIYKCKLCSCETKWKGSLRTHMLIHKDSSDVVMYRCPKCTFETKYKYSLKSHMLIHKDNSEVTMHKCNLCSYESKWKYNLRSHMLTHKDSSDIMYKCELCTHKTKRKADLKKHIIHIHHAGSSKVIMYKCNICSYESKWKSSLKYHVLTHKDSSEIVMYRCERCRFKTKCKYYLKRHMQNHKDNSHHIRSDVNCLILKQHIGGTLRVPL